MKKSLKFIVFFVLSGITLDASFCSSFVNPFSPEQLQLLMHWELTPKYYPKTVTYFDTLKLKYPVLNTVKIIIGINGPAAAFNTIYFPIKWIEELEKGNKFYLQGTEWIILHELGHLQHYDTYKGIVVGTVFGVALQQSVDKALSYLGIESNNLFNIPLIMGSYMVVISILKSIFHMEYFADDYAMDHCDNPQAWIAAYEFLDRFAPLGWWPGISHSFTKYRLSRIEGRFKKKFGKKLVIIPQSLNPVYQV